jgi:hypothetical protein
MKPLFACMFLFLSFMRLPAQELFPSDSNGTVEYKAIIETSGAKDDLYKKAKLWIAKSFSNPSDVIKMDDISSGLIKLTYSAPFIEGYNLVASMLIEIKDNKIRCTVNDIYLPVEPHLQNNMTAEGINRRIKEKTDKGAKPLKFLTDAVIMGNIQITSLVTSLKQSFAKTDDF